MITILMALIAMIPQDPHPQTNLPRSVNIDQNIKMRATYALDSITVELPGVGEIGQQKITYSADAFRFPSVANYSANATPVESSVNHAGAVTRSRVVPATPIGVTHIYPYSNASGSVAPQNNYRPTWTWPGDLRNHLTGPPHYIARDRVDAMSQDQLERLHDSLHNRSSRGRTGFRTPIRGLFRNR